MPIYMYMMCWLTTCLLPLLNCLFSTAFVKDFPTVVLEIKPGILLGQQEIFLHNGINATTSSFLGIPYAEAPLQGQRFRPPVHVDGWINRTHPFQAFYERPLCADVDLASNTLYGSEDCLYINIYVPNGFTEVQAYLLMLPVMIYLPPRNAMNSVLPDPRLLVHKESIIVVTIAYRTGVLGFLSYDSIDAPGNVGLLDQQLAIKWIWDNIRDFGGDPDDITLLGDAEGATSVLLHSLSPDSNTIRRAIVQNAVIQSIAMLQHDARERVDHLALLLTCSQNDIIDCIRAHTLRDLLSHSWTLESDIGPWLPVSDGKVVPEFDSIQQLVEKFHVTDLLIGFNEYAAYNAITHSLHPMADGRVLTTLYEAMLYIAERHNSGKHVEQIHRLLSNEYAECYIDDFIVEQQVIAKLLTDYLYAAPMLGIVERFSQTHHVYVYEFTYKSRFIDDDRPAYITAALHDQISYLFGSPTMDTWPVAEKEFGEAIRSGWAKFIRSGNPNSLLPDGGVTWSLFNKLEQSYLKLDLPLDGDLEKRFLRGRQMSFWNQYLPHVLNSTDCTQYHSYCHKKVKSMAQRHQQTYTMVFVLSGVVGVLCLLVVLLLLTHLVSCDTWKRLLSRRRKEHHLPNIEQERKKLHPLPYCDDT